MISAEHICIGNLRANLIYLARNEHRLMSAFAVVHLLKAMLTPAICRRWTLMLLGTLQVVLP
jgi:predicted glycosyltransferase